MNSHSLVLLRRRHQHRLWMAPLYVAALGLVIELLLAWAGTTPRVQLAALAIVVVLALFVRIWPRRTLIETARALDRQAGAHNRLEAVAELDGRIDPLASALRAETDAYLAHHPLPRSQGWIASTAAFVALLVANLTLLGPGWLETFSVSAALPAPSPAVTKIESPPAQSEPQPLSATLRWITPAEEIAAAANEVIPLAAEAESATGLRRVVLHVARNGQPLPPVSVAEEIGAGKRPVSSSLPLDVLDLKPFDVVTYYLRAERIRTEDIVSDPSPIASPLQFVQIQSPRDEALGDVFSECTAGCLLDVVRRLKHEQIAVLRNVVALAHETELPADVGRLERVQSAESRQSAIQEETRTLLEALADAGITGGISNSLTLAEVDAGNSAAELARAQPAAAIEPAGRALAQFAAAEKALAKLVIANRLRAPTVPDVLDLPSRETTPAGRLEKMAVQQGVVAEKLASRATSDGIVNEQEQLTREMENLAAEGALPVSINALVKSAAEAATEAVRQLHEQDTLAATEPATRAAQSLDEAVSAVKSMAHARAVDELAAAQRALIRTATNLQIAAPAELAETASTAGERVTTIHRDVRDAARRQQSQGSAEAAQRLNELAKAIMQSGVQKELITLAQSREKAAELENQQLKESVVRKLTQLAQRAADGAVGFENGPIAQARAMDELRRAQANLDRAATLPGEGRIAVRDTPGVVDFYEKALENAQRLANVDSRERGMPPPPGPGAPLSERQAYAARLSQRIAGLLEIAAAAVSASPRVQVLTTANPGDAPPAYRAAVADYFEALARDRVTRLPPQP